MQKTYIVWKIGKSGKYLELVKAYKTESGAEKRARKEAEEAWRSGMKFIVSADYGRPMSAENIRAEKIGMGDAEYKGNAEIEFEVR